MSKFCTYLTVYKGNKLPMFYIGSTEISKVHKGYKGTVSSKEYKKLWKEELEKYPQLFKTYIISFHNSRAEAYDKEEYFQRKLNVVSSSMYCNMSYANSRPSFKGRSHSEETKRLKSSIQTGYRHTDEAKEKMSKIHKGKILSKEHNEALQKSKIEKHSPQSIEKIKSWWSSEEGMAHRRKRSLEMKGTKREGNFKKTTEQKEKTSYGKSPLAVPVTINGKYYDSVSRAAEELFPSKDKITSRHTLYRKIRTGKLVVLYHR